MGRDRWSAAGLALLALAYLLAARRYPLDTLATPGPGIVPLVAGLALLGVAICLFVVTGRVGATRTLNRAVIVAGSARPAQTAGGLSEIRGAPTRPTEPVLERPTEPALERQAEPAPRARWSPLVLAVVLVLYAALLPRLGFIASSFALVVVASRLMGAPGWWRPAALALGVAGVSYLLFARWLGVPLP